MKGVLLAVEKKEYLSDNLSWLLSADEKTSALRELARKRKEVLFDPGLDPTPPSNKL